MNFNKCSAWQCTFALKPAIANPTDSENIYLRGSPTGHAKPRDTSEQSFSSSHRAFAALVGHDGQSVNQHYLRWTNKRITRNDLTICKQSNSAPKWSNTVQPLLANSGFDRLKGTSSKIRCFEAPCLRAPARQHVEGCDIDCWMVRVEPKSHLGFNEESVVFAKMHVPHCRDRRLEMQRPVTTKKGNFKASRLEFFRTRKHMIRKQCSLSDLNHWKGSWIVIRIYHSWRE